MVIAVEVLAAGFGVQIFPVFHLSPYNAIAITGIMTAIEIGRNRMEKKMPARSGSPIRLCTGFLVSMCAMLVWGCSEFGALQSKGNARTTACVEEGEDMRTAGTSMVMYACVLMRMLRTPVPLSRLPVHSLFGLVVANRTQ